MTPPIPSPDATRRTVLKAMAVGIGLLAVGGAGRWVARLLSRGDGGGADGLASLARPTLWPLGEAYVRAHPHERDADTLVHALRRAGVTATGGRRAMAAATRHDFASGNTVDIDGWLLSRTEARVCALAWVRRARVPLSGLFT